MSDLFKSRPLGYLVGLLLFTGCLTIEENYTFKKNGSGTMEYVVDISELGKLMESFSELGEGKQDGSSEGLGAMDMSEQVNALKAIPGVGKVKLDKKKKWVQKVSFTFKDVNALNAALNQLMRDSSGVAHEFFRWEGNTLVRSNNRHAYEIGANMAKGEDEGPGESGEEGEEQGLDMGGMLEAMKYKYSFRFARPIASTTSAEGVNKVEKGSKEVLLDTDFAVISKDEKALDLRIAFDR
jgi:hypothetical protein